MSLSLRSPNEEIVSVKNLTKLFYRSDFFNRNATNIYAVNNISFNMKRGEILGLLGPNGAGKTTTVHMLLGILKPSSGTISYFGKTFNDDRSEILKKLAFASSSIQLAAALSVWQNLDIHGRLFGLTGIERSTKIEKLLKTFGVWHLKNTKTGHLSSGQANRIILAKAFLTDPSIVLLDEATAALDPEMAQETQNFLLEQCEKKGTSFLLASHNMSEVARICSRVLMMKEGVIVADDNPKHLVQEILKVRLSLVGSNINQLQQCAERYKFSYFLDHNTIKIELDEKQIAPFLSKLAQEQITYNQIAIDKPSLEDYFFHMARKA